MTFGQLQSDLHKVRYPDEMQYISLGIKGQGFFPGALGTTQSLHKAGGILLLGQDFGTTEYYNSRIGQNDEHCLTWDNTCQTYCKLFRGKHVWYSNYLMGARKPPLPATGDLEELIKDPAEWSTYEEDCWRFLHAQVDYQRPELIVVLGNPNRKRLSRDSRLRTNWDKFASITSAIRASSDRVDPVTYSFPCSDGGKHATSLVLAFHPCYGQGTKKKALIEADAQRVYLVHSSLMSNGLKSFVYAK